MYKNTPPPNSPVSSTPRRAEAQRALNKIINHHFTLKKSISVTNPPVSELVPPPPCGTLTWFANSLKCHFCNYVQEQYLGENLGVTGSWSHLSENKIKSNEIKSCIIAWIWIKYCPRPKMLLRVPVI